MSKTIILSGETPCAACGVLLRSSKRTLEAFPGTRSHAGFGLCQRCYQRLYRRAAGAPVQAPPTPDGTPCRGCGRAMRPKGSRRADYPHRQVSHRAQRYCTGCYPHHHSTPATEAARARFLERDAARRAAKAAKEEAKRQRAAKAALAEAKARQARAEAAARARAKKTGDDKPATVPGLNSPDPDIRATAQRVQDMLESRRARGIPAHGRLRPVIV